MKSYSPPGFSSMSVMRATGIRLPVRLGNDADLGALAEHRRIIRDACASEGGVEVDTQGDAFFFAFQTASGALSAAGAFTDALASGPIHVRVGLHTGTPLLTEEGYVGGDVHRAARIAAGHGARVVVAEEYRFGGTCVIRGCVPKKLLVYASHVHEDIRDAAGFGWTIPEARFDWATLIANKDKEIARLEAAYHATLDNAKVWIEKSRAVLEDEHTVRLLESGERVRARHERQSTTQGVTLDTHVETGADGLVGDGDRLEQALQNLAANALRHTPEGGSVRLDAARTGGQIRIRVRDTGPGIPPDHLPLIFERFYKVDRARTRGVTGSGLGLAITRHLVVLQGGRIWTEAAKGGGQLFAIELPRA